MGRSATTSTPGFVSASRQPYLAVLVTLLFGCSGVLGPNMNTKNGVAKAYERRFGHSVDHLDDLCVEWSEPFEGLVLIGYFAMDAGCIGQGAFWGRDFHDDPTLLKSLAFPKAGWANRSGREELALRWINDIYLGFNITRIIEF